MSGALGKKSSTLRSNNKSRDKFIKGDIVQYNLSTRELHYVSEGKHKTVKLEKDEAMRYLKYFRRCTKGLALDYLVQHHFRTNEGTYQVLQLSTRMSSPEETQKIVRDCETKFKKLIELADSKVKSKIVAVHLVVKKMLDAKNRVSIIRDIFFPELVDQHGLKTILDNKDITEFKDSSIDHDKYTTYIDSDYDKNGLIKVMKKDGAEKTYTYFAAKVCESIYDNAKALETGKKLADKIRNSILVIYMTLNSSITQKSICGSLYFPVKENDYFLVNITKAYGIEQNKINSFVIDNELNDELSFRFFTESHEAPLDFEWFIPWKEEYMAKQAQREYNFRSFEECKKAWKYIYTIQNRGNADACDLLSGSKALVIWSLYHKSEIANVIQKAFDNQILAGRLKTGTLLHFFVSLALRYEYTFNLDIQKINTNSLFVDTFDGIDRPGLMYKLANKPETDRIAKVDYNTLKDILTNPKRGSEILNKQVFKPDGIVLYNGGKDYNEKAYKDWCNKLERKARKQIIDKIDEAEMNEYNEKGTKQQAIAEVEAILDPTTEEDKNKYNKMSLQDKQDLINGILKKYKRDGFASEEEVRAWIAKNKDEGNTNTELIQDMENEELETTNIQHTNIQPQPQPQPQSKKGKKEKQYNEPSKEAQQTAQPIQQSNVIVTGPKPQMTTDADFEVNNKLLETLDGKNSVIGDNASNPAGGDAETGGEHKDGNGLSLRKLKKMGLKPWQIKQIRKEVKKMPKAGISELETLNEIKEMLEALLGKQNNVPVDKARLPIQPPEQTAQLQAQTSKAENIASIPMLLGDDLNARRRALRHVEQTHYVPEVDKNTVKYDIENRNYTLKHVDPVKVAKTLQGLDKMLRKGTLAKNSPYVRLHPASAAVIKMLATRANPNTYKGGVFRTIASLIPGGSAVYEVASRVYNAARPLIDKAVQKYDKAYNNKMKPKGCNSRRRPNGYMNAKQLKQYLIHNQKPKLSQLSQLLK